MADRTATAPRPPRDDQPTRAKRRQARPKAPAPPPVERRQADSAAAAEADAERRDVFAVWDRYAHAALGRLTAGVSPATLMDAYGDWLSHLAISPGKQAQLMYKAQRKAARLAGYLPASTLGREGRRCIEPLAGDKRFADEQWMDWPFNLYHQAFLLTQQWWHNATTSVPGVNSHHEDVVNFTTRQYLDFFSPANHPLTNPKVLARTAERSGQNLVEGAFNFWEDMTRLAGGRPPAGAEAYLPGESVAVTPGKVVHRNRLMELIQYSPATDKVRAEPLLIVPAWIMKYYILDLSPYNSLVRWLVEQGHTVFMISWKNPDAGDRDLGMEDYRQLGIMEALEAVNAIVPQRKVHAVGYCLGGTLLAIAAAEMARRGDDRFETFTLFASLTDFEEAGELELFIDESQVNFLEDVMAQQGYLESWQMKGAFQLLQSQDLIWSRMVQEYLMGERMPMFDLMAWSTDGTRMPYRMHSEYLRRLYLDNELSEGRFRIDGRIVDLADIALPTFVVSTRKDHIAPWRSVYRIQLRAGGDVTYVLTSGGHNAGVVSEPGHRGRVYQIADKPADAPYVAPDTWYEKVPEREGSWWPEWRAWLLEHADREVEPPPMGAPDKGYQPLEDAPGQYVRQRTP